MVHDPKNSALVCDVGPDSQHKIGSSVLCLALDRISKAKGQHYTIGRGKDSDIIVTGDTGSKCHCLISICPHCYIPMLHEQSTNGTQVNGKFLNNQVLEIQNNMTIKIAGALFNIQLPWQGEGQQDYEYEVRRANEGRAQTPSAVPSRVKLKELLPPTKLLQNVGAYSLTGIPIGSASKMSNLVTTEVVQKGASFFAAKWFNVSCKNNHKLKALKAIKQHVSFSVYNVHFNC